VDQEPLPYPEKATILGPGMTIPKEMAGFNVRLIDLQLPAQAETGRKWFGQHAALTDTTAALRAQLRDDLFATPGSDVVAYRDGRRWSRSYLPLALTEPAPERVGFRT